MTDQQEVGLPYALSIGAKIIDLGWPWMVDTHLIAEKMYLLEPNTNRPILMGDEPEWKQRKLMFF